MRTGLPRGDREVVLDAQVRAALVGPLGEEADGAAVAEHERIAHDLRSLRAGCQDPTVTAQPGSKKRASADPRRAALA
ncbi:hypothetical protein GCM10009854_17410 [Saccharopolyspora halophila]|uniref:DUF222 domain-containing protein n=1 Tax=Saccharopolyspora halophila TaxID=405551 RepID=A0ABN3G0B5_9PSEU